MPAPYSVVLNYTSPTVAFLTFQVMGLLACAKMPDFQGLHVNKKASIQLSSDFPNVFARIKITNI